MASNKLWNSEKDEILIELVKGKRGLYDLQSQYYSDNNYKRKMWNEVEEAVGLPGAKNRWEALRAQYRKYLAKLKTKCGQAATKICKWRYHDQMQFITEFINCDRPRISSIIDEEGDNENIHDMDIEETDGRTVVSKEIDASEEVELDIDPVNTFTTNVPPARKKQNKQKNTGVQQENASSTIMKYILDKKAQERTAHPIDNVFALIAGTVKTFSAVDQHFMKTKVFTLASEIEERYITAASSPVFSSASVHHCQVSPAPSTYSTSSSSSFNFDEINQPHSQDSSRDCPTPLSQHACYDKNLRPTTSRIISAPKTLTSSEAVHSQTQYTLPPFSSPLSTHYAMNTEEQHQTTLYEMSSASNRN